MAELTNITGFYDLVGTLIEIAEFHGRLIVRFDGVPDRLAPTLRATDESTFVVDTGTLAGAEISFDQARALIGGVLPVERLDQRPPSPPWPSGHGLILTDPSPGEDEEDAHLRLWSEVNHRSDGAWINWELPWPRYRFVEWLTRRRQVIFHGSPQPDLDTFVPRRGSIELFDHGGRGNLGAIYGTPYGLWSMWFAVINRSELQGSIRNGVLSFESAEGETLDVYNFSVHHEFLGQPIWHTGTLYLLSPDTFSPIPFYPGGPPSNEWASTVEQSPIARLEVRPEDFPFIDRIGGHDDSELIAAEQLGDVVTQHIDSARRNGGGVSVHLRWDEEIAAIIDPYLESRRRFTPDVNRQHRLDPSGEHWIDVDGPEGFLQTYEKLLVSNGIVIAPD